MTLKELSGWGRVPSARSYVTPVSTADAIVLDGLPRGAIARGLGRGYGDCAQNTGGSVFDVTPLTALELNESTGVVTAGAGISIEDLLSTCVPKGWFPPVTPGTKHITVGGAIAADVHGKNHHRDGSITRHISEISLYTSSGTVERLTRESSEFRATAGGLGLTGLVLSAHVSMITIETSKILVDTLRAPNLDDLMAAMLSDDDHYRYSVAWIDLMAGGASLGRGILSRGDHAPVDALNSSSSSLPLDYPRTRTLQIPDVFPSGLLNRATIRAFNEVWYRKAPSSRNGEIQSIEHFFYPLDMLADWNRLYGRRGFLQYQFAVPDSGIETLRTIIAEISERRFPTFLAVLKRFGPGNGLLSFPIAGWTLALDIPIGVSDLAATLDRFDTYICEAGGRVYLAKDSRLKPDMFRTMYPEFEKWLEIRERLDPTGTWQSDLSRRLRLARGAA